MIPVVLCLDMCLIFRSAENVLPRCSQPTSVRTLCDTLFLLQDQEIGMANVLASWDIKDYLDVEGRNYYQSVLEKRRDGADMKDFMRELRKHAIMDDYPCSGMPVRTRGLPKPRHLG